MSFGASGGRLALRCARLSALFAVTMALASCSLPTQQLSFPGPLTTGALDRPTSKKPGVPLSNPADPETREPRVREGTDQFAAETPRGSAEAGDGAGRARTTGQSPGASQSSDGITLNFSGASIQEVARTVLGDVLGLNYTVSEELKGAITIKTARPIPRGEVLATVESVLKSEGAAIVVENGIHRIVPQAAAGAGSLRRTATKGGQAPRVGIGTEVIPLRHVVPDDMQRLITAIAPQGAKITAEPARNLLIAVGTAAEVASIREMVAVFDVDWMRGASFGLYPVDTDPEAIALELDTIFANDRSSPTKGMVRFIPNKRLKSILIISSRAEYLRKAEGWLKRVDLVGQESEKQVHVYRVQHRPATELAVLLQRVYGQQQAARQQGRADLPPSVTATTTLSSDVTPSTDGVRPIGAPIGVSAVAVQPVPSIVTPGALVQPGVQMAPAAQSPVPPNGTAPLPVDLAPVPAPTTGASRTSVPDDRTAGIEVTADEANNSLIVTATVREFKRVRQILSRIDIAPAQLLLEATIAEVTLNDRLQFGLRWFFERGQSRVTLTDAAAGVVASRLPGFSYFLNTPNVQVALNALSDVTDVNIVSSPSLMVIDNKKAQLQIGDEVPIATQSAVGVLAPGAPIVNSINFRNTGVILNITPQISDDGRIVLDIEQEVSDVVPTTSSNIDSPTIQQRRIKTKVAVGNGEAIVLAGFMQDRAQRGRQQVPVLGNIPVVGNLFKDKNDQIRRTELLIAITPHIVKDAHQIRSIAAEFRDRMNFTTRPQRTAPPDRRENVDRVVR